MDVLKATTVVLYCAVLFCSGISGSCDINLTAFTADCYDQNLDKVPSYVPDSTKVLNLAHNRFKEVNPRQFRRFYNLVDLDLSWNKIEQLNNDSETELSTIRVLDISYNRRLQDLNSAFFAGIPNLQKLSISGNDLEVSMFKGLRNLTYLDMSRNRLINVNSTPFVELENLEELYLSFCGLTNLRGTMFTGLSNLLELNLRRNELKHLSSRVFVRLTKLKVLDVSENILEHLPSGVFVTLTKLKVLDLNDNRLEHLPSGVFVGLPKLKVLDLSGNQLYYGTSLPSDIFQPLSHLEKLLVNTFLDYLRYVNYTYMDNPISKLPSLKRLYITGAQNSKFGPGYTNLKNLEYVQIYGNISEINNETFVNLRYTHSLTLSLVDCQFSSISQNAFTSLINLKSLDVSSNMYLCKYTMWRNFTAAINNGRIKDLIATHLCPFERGVLRICDAPYLELLKISYNNLAFWGSCSNSFKELYLDHNNIQTLYPLRYMYNLEKLDLSDQTSSGVSIDQYLAYTVPSAPLYNTYSDLNKTAQNIELKDMNMTFEGQARNMAFKGQGFNSEARFTRQLDPIPAFLEWIDISKSCLICDLYDLDNTNNSIKTLKISQFRPCSKLVFLCNTDRMLNGLWPWLDRLTKVEYLDLSWNYIKAIPLTAFMHTLCLKHLDLSHNSIATLTFETKYLINIKDFYLSNNVIQDASRQFMTGIISNDLTIYLDNNNLLCDCAKSNFAQWLSTTNVVYNITGLMCKYENKSQVSLSHRAAIYQLLKDECIYVIVTVTCVLVFIFLLIGGVAVAILLHKRWKEQYLSVFVRRSVNPYHPLEECQIELEYDIYISYERDHDITAHETMHDFVTKKLYPWLKRRGFKVLIRDELYAGKKLYTEISEALRKTRNVIVLLSNDYCVDFWNVFEFNTAATEGIYTKRQVIIPVTFEILNPVVFHEEITAFLKSGPLPRCTPNTNFTKLTDYLIEKLSY